MILLKKKVPDGVSEAFEIWIVYWRNRDHTEENQEQTVRKQLSAEPAIGLMFGKSRLLTL